MSQDVHNPPWSLVSHPHTHCKLNSHPGANFDLSATSNDSIKHTQTHNTCRQTAEGEQRKQRLLPNKQVRVSQQRVSPQEQGRCESDLHIYCGRKQKILALLLYLLHWSRQTISVILIKR